MKCLNCRYEFERKQGPGRKPKFCGDDCRRAFQNKRRASDNGYEYRPLGMVQCGRCGNNFEANSSQAKYCPECRPVVNLERSRERNQRLSQEANANAKTHQCRRCGKEFITNLIKHYCDKCGELHRQERNSESMRALRKKRSEQGISLVVAVPDAKECPRCHEVKAASEFGPAKDRPTGLQTYCRACRAERATEARKAGKYKVPPKPKRVKICPICGNRSLTKYCSRECELEDGRRKWNETAAENDRKRKTPRQCICRECGQVFDTEYRDKRRTFCSDKCREKLGKRIGHAVRRARAASAGVIENIDPRYILNRDDWRCYLCGVKTPKKYRGTCEPNAPEVDHVLPLARGGSHTESNLRCICRRCNQEKAAKTLDELHVSISIQLRLL